MILGDEHAELLAQHDRERKAKRNQLIGAAVICGFATFFFNMYYIGAPYDLALAYSIGLIMAGVVLALIVGFFVEKNLPAFLVIWLLLIIFQIVFPSIFEPRDRLADIPPGGQAAVELKLKSVYKEYKPIGFKAYLYPGRKYIIFAEYYYEYNSELDYGASRIEPYIVFERGGMWEVAVATIANQQIHGIDISKTPYCADLKENPDKRSFCRAP